MVVVCADTLPMPKMEAVLLKTRFRLPDTVPAPLTVDVEANDIEAVAAIAPEPLTVPDTLVLSAGAPSRLAVPMAVLDAPNAVEVAPEVGT